jgi:hypothetical protein
MTWGGELGKERRVATSRQAQTRRNMKTPWKPLKADRELRDGHKVRGHLPNSITRKPLATSLWARSARAMLGVEMPWISRILGPYSGPHSYARVVPYGLSTSLAPGRASGGYGSWADTCGAGRERAVMLGEGMCFGWLSGASRACQRLQTARAPTEVAPATRHRDQGAGGLSRDVTCGNIISKQLGWTRLDADGGGDWDGRFSVCPTRARAGARRSFSIRHTVRLPVSDTRSLAMGWRGWVHWRWDGEDGLIGDGMETEMGMGMGMEVAPLVEHIARGRRHSCGTRGSRLLTAPYSTIHTRALSLSLFLST